MSDESSSLIDKNAEQDINIETLKTRIAELELSLGEKRRGWVRVGILICFFTAFGYMIFKFTGQTEGMIKPETVYSYLTGIISGKIIEHYINADTFKSDRFL